MDYVTFNQCPVLNIVWSFYLYKYYVSTNGKVKSKDIVNYYIYINIYPQIVAVTLFHVAVKI